jgi:hypothetical protein
MTKGERERSCLIKKKRDYRGWACGNGLGETKGTEQGGRVEECREECEDGEEVELGNKEQFCRVVVVPVSEFMG